MNKVAPVLSSFALASLTLACSSLPAVVSTNPEGVSVEFAVDGTAAEAGELATAECAKYGKLADFEQVDPTATSESRIANFRCIEQTGVAPVGTAPPTE